MALSNTKEEYYFEKYKKNCVIVLKKRVSLYRSAVH